MRAFSLVAVSRVYSLVESVGFALQWLFLLQSTVSRVLRLQKLQCMGSVTAVPSLESTGSIVVEQELSCSGAHGIFPTQGSNRYLLYWQVHSLPPSHGEAPIVFFYWNVFFWLWYQDNADRNWEFWNFRLLRIFCIGKRGPVSIAGVLPFLETIKRLCLRQVPPKMMLVFLKFLPFSSVQFGHSVMSDSLWPYGLQHAGLPCPSPTPPAYSNSCPSSRWCRPTISSSVVPYSSRLQSFPASGSFPVSQFFTSGGQSIGVSASASVLPMHIQDWFPLGFPWVQEISRVYSNTTV